MRGSTASQRRVTWVIDLVGRHVAHTGEILSRSRERSTATARAYAMATCKQAFSWSYPETGFLFDRDHTSVMHACRRLRGDALLADLVEETRRAFAPVRLVHSSSSVIPVFPQGGMVRSR